MDGMVMRSVFLRPQEDSQLRQLAHDLHVSKSDLIRSAISAKLKQWLEDASDESVNADLELGRRGGTVANRNSGSAKTAEAPTAEMQKSAARGKAAASPKAKAGSKKSEQKDLSPSSRKVARSNQEKIAAG